MTANGASFRVRGAALVASALFAGWLNAQSTIRVGMPSTPRSLDPAKAEVSQEYMAMAGIYDTPFTLDPLARPAVLVPLAAAGLPEISDDFRTYTIRVRPGIFFTPHPAFGGKPRELTAADFGYSIRRILDPKVRSPNLYSLEGRIEGLDELARRAKDSGRAIDYDASVPGLVVVDRYTLRIHLNAPDPRFGWLLVSPMLAGVAREVVDAEGAGYGLRPIGTGAFKVESFTPGQRLTLVRNPEFRELRWESLLSSVSRNLASTHPMRGRRLPALDRVELFSTPESSAELLALRNGEVDLIMLLEPELAMRGGRLDDDLVRAGMRLVRDPSPLVWAWHFSMRDPAVGGDSRERVALRRAIAMAFDDDEWIRVMAAGQSRRPEQMIPPETEGHVPGYRSPNRYDPSTANALLDRMGFARGRDGFRRNPDGSALAVAWLIGTNSEQRKRAEFVKRMFDRIGVRVAFDAAPGAERVKRMLACSYGMTSMDIALGPLDGTDVMGNFHRKAIGSANTTCFRDAPFDAAYEAALVARSGPARIELFRTMQARLDTYVPARPIPAASILILTRPHVVGPFGISGDWLQLLTLGTNDGKAIPR